MTTHPQPEMTSIEQHPDILALRAHYEAAAEAPTAQLVEGGLILSGLWAAIAPWVVNFRSGSPSLAISDLIIGLSVALLAFSFGTAYSRTHRIAWITPLLGIWLVITPWVIQNNRLDGGTIAANVVAGACVLLFGALAARMATIVPALKPRVSARTAIRR